MRPRSGTAAAAAAAVAAVLALTGCGLPLSDGVQRPGTVPAEKQAAEPISVLPPGPQPGATPEEVVLGFLVAQGSGRDEHGVARGFLAPDARQRWDDAAGVTVIDPTTQETSSLPAEDGGVVVTLTVQVLGEVGADASARVLRPEERKQEYRLRQVDGQWRLVDVPPGLTLSPPGRDRALDPASVFFLAPTGSGRPHLVADLLQLPADGDRAGQLVERLLAGPSSALATSARSAVPAGARLRAAVSTDASGVVTVDLTGLAGPDDLDAATRQDLSAQLVWTLTKGVPGFARLRLLVDGVPLVVPGVGQPQPRGAWAAYAPEGPQQRQPALAIVDGGVVDLEPSDEDREPPSLPGVTGAVDLAVDARSGRLAVLTDGGSGRTLLGGPAAGPLVAVAQGAGLASPTWGDGDSGLWLLRTGADPAVLRVPPGSDPVRVDVEGLPTPLPADALLRVSRDGVRVALVAAGVLRVGRVEPSASGPRVVGWRELETNVRDVAWRDGTTLDVLLEDLRPPLLPLVRVSVDGTVTSPTPVVGVAQGEPVALASAGELSPLLVEIRADNVSTVYGNQDGGLEVRLRGASRPAYPR